MSKQIRKRLEIIEDRFGKMALRDFIKVEGGPDTPLHKAAHSGDYQRLKILVEEEELFGSLNSKNYLGCTPLRLAATAGHEECVRYLVEQKADVNVSDIKAQTALYVAVKNKHLKCVRILLQAGANPDGDPHCLCTPLYVAAMDGNLPVLQELIAFGAGVDKCQINLGTFISAPLYITIAYHHLDCFKALLLSGANPDGAASSDRTPRHSLPKCDSLYHAAVKHSCSVEYVDLLYEFGAALHHEDEKGRLACEADMLNHCSQRIRELLSVPRSLQSSVRLFLRRYLGKETSTLQGLPLPNRLIQYLQYL